MNRGIAPLAALLALASGCVEAPGLPRRHTTVSSRGDAFFINGKSIQR